ncbi:MAG: TonB-dependent receptor [Pseudomonadales bacterium]
MKLKFQKKSRLMGLAIVAASLSIEPVLAQTMLEEVIVTANKRETALMKTGISITAFTADHLKEYGIDNLEDLTAATPNLQVTGTDRITIRGVGIDLVTLGIDPGVGTYADGFYLSGVGPYRANNFYDLERIEVLRGPQGTLYGRNTAGGAVNLVSKKPQSEFEGEVNVEVGNEGYTVAQGMLNIPMGDKFALRGSLSKIDRDGLQTNDVGPDVDAIDNKSYDTTLRADWTDSWRTDFRAFGYNRAGAPTSGYMTEAYDTTTWFFPSAVTVNPQFGWDQANPAVNDKSATSLDVENSQDEKHNNFLLTNINDVGDVEIKYIGGYSKSEQDKTRDLDFSSATASSVVEHETYDIERTSHELTFTSDFDSKLNFVGGLYYFKSDEKAYFDYANATDPIYSTDMTWATDLVTLALALPTPFPYFPGQRYGIATLPGALMGLYYFGDPEFKPYDDFVGDPQNRNFWVDIELETESYAAYGQLDYDLSDKWNFTLGLRYSYDEKTGYENSTAFVGATEDYDAAFYYPVGGTPEEPIYGLVILESETHKMAGNSIGYPLHNSDIASDNEDWDNLSGLLRAEYSLDDSGFIYGSISTGYRAGGFNLGQPAEGIDGFDPEEIISYELGYKGTLVDNTLNFDVAAFFYDYSDMQVNQQFFKDGVIGNEINNAGSAEVKGIEMQVAWLLSDQLTLSGNYAYTDAEYTDFVTINTSAGETEPENLAGNKLNRSPENTFSAAINYWIPLGDAGNLSLTASYSWMDEQYTDAFNDERGLVESWDRADARATWTSASESLAITGYIKNIADDRYTVDAVVGGASGGFQRVERLADPRMYGVRVTYKF